MEYNFRNYAKLLEKVDNFLLKVRNRYVDQIHCQKGCDSCCQAEPGVFAIEAVYMKAKFDSLPAKIRNFVLAQVEEGGPCPLLVFGTCSIYDSRPIMCRTHGYPILVEDGGDTFVDTCGMNFRGLIERSLVERDYIINLQTLNVTLAAVNQQFCLTTFGNTFDSGTRFAVGDIVSTDFDKMAKAAEVVPARDARSSAPPKAAPPASLFKRKKGEPRPVAHERVQETQPAVEEVVPPGALKQFITEHKVKKGAQCPRGPAELMQVDSHTAGAPAAQAAPGSAKKGRAADGRPTFKDLFIETTRQAMDAHDQEIVEPWDSATIEELRPEAAGVDDGAGPGHETEHAEHANEEEQVVVPPAFEDTGDDAAVEIVPVALEEDIHEVMPEPQVTSDDVYLALDALAASSKKINERELLERYFPLRSHLMKETSRRHGVKRAAARSWYFGGSDDIPAPGYADIHVIYAVAFDEAGLDALEGGIAHFSGVRQVYAAPRIPLQIPEIMGEISGLEDLTGTEQFQKGNGPAVLDEVRNEVLARFTAEIRAYLDSKNFRFFCRGKSLDVDASRRPARILDDLASCVYNMRPDLDFPSSARLRSLLLDEAGDMILRGKGEVTAPRKGKYGALEILRKILIDGGALTLRSESPDTRFYAIRRAIPEEAPLHRTWTLLIKAFLGQVSEGEAPLLASAISELAAPPFGIPAPVLEILAAAAYIACADDIVLLEDGREAEATPECFRRLIAQPDHFSTRAVALKSGEREFLEGILSLIGRSPGSADLREECAAALKEWAAGLPPLAGALAGSDEARTFLRLITSQRADFRTLPLRDIPAAFGFEGEGDARALLDKVKIICDDLSGIVAREAAALTAALAASFGLAGRDADELSEGLKQWRSALGYEPAEGSFSPDCLALWNCLGRDLPDGRAFFLDTLPEAMGLGPFVLWDRDRRDEYRARVRRAVLDLQFFRLREFFPVPADGPKRKDHFRTWFDKTMNDLAIHGGDRESLLVDLLEGTVW